MSSCRRQPFVCREIGSLNKELGRCARAAVIGQNRKLDCFFFVMAVHPLHEVAERFFSYFRAALIDIMDDIVCEERQKFFHFAMVEKVVVSLNDLCMHGSLQKMKRSIRIVSYVGEEVKGLIPQIAKLRIEVFAEYPFLYIGDLEYEKRYLKKFSEMEDAIAVACFEGEELVGISTGYPFIYEAKDLQAVLAKKGLRPEDYFCLGESVLRKTVRGQGIGNRFFDEREAHVKRLGRYKHICFYTSLRPENDPRRPADYRPLDPFWKKRGYQEHPELVGTVSYQEIGEEAESPKKMVFWIKDL